jgi:hypothetical protein
MRTLAMPKTAQSWSVTLARNLSDGADAPNASLVDDRSP